MPKLNFTKVAIDAIKPVSLRIIYWDTALTGFGLRVSPHGRKTYVAQYRVNGREHRVKIGEHGVLTLDEARREARVILANASRGTNEVAERRERERKGIKVGEIYETWMERHVRAKREPRTVKDYQDIWQRYLKGRFAKKVAIEVRRSDVADLHHELRAIPKSANYAVIVLKAIFGYAIKQELIDDRYRNPASGHELYPEEAREAFLAPEEIRRIGDAMSDMLREGSLHKGAAAGLLLCMLTGARSGVVKTLLWTEVDIPNRRLVFAKKRKRLRYLELNEVAIAALQSIERIPGNPYVIAGRKVGKHLYDFRRQWLAIKERAGIDDVSRGTVRVHDLRHTFASMAISSGVPIEVISKLLGHAKISTTQRYSHLTKSVVSVASEDVGRQISGHLSGMPLITNDK